QSVGDLNWRSGDGEVSARRSDPLIELADREIVLVGDLADQRRSALHTLCGWSGRQWAVEIVTLQIERAPGQTVEQADAVLFQNEGREAIVFCARLIFRATDKG